MKSSTRNLSLVAALSLGVVGAQGVRTHSDCRREMEKYRQAHPVCEHINNYAFLLTATGTFHSVEVAVHHRVSIRECLLTGQFGLITNQANFVTLCDPRDDRKDGCHFVCGHGRNWKTSNANVEECVR